MEHVAVDTDDQDSYPDPDMSKNKNNSVYACDDKECPLYGLASVDMWCAQCGCIRVHVGYLVPVDASADHVTLDPDKP